MFDGSDYKPELDQVRLTGQLKRIYDFMSDGQWWSVQEISNFTGDPENSVSAQLRNLRKLRFGGHTIERERKGNPKYGYSKYRLKVGQLDLAI